MRSFFPTPLHPASFFESNIILPFKHRKCSLIIMIKILTMLKLYPCLSRKSMILWSCFTPYLNTQPWYVSEETNKRNKSRKELQLKTDGESSDLHTKNESMQANINTQDYLLVNMFFFLVPLKSVLRTFKENSLSVSRDVREIFWVFKI